ncbi:hypothetical protein TNCV_1658491 [Trichonephila clavipes]|nr:hypothetical protein TNCV_1658491 [Trichonephila clavipes]
MPYKTHLNSGRLLSVCYEADYPCYCSAMVLVSPFGVSLKVEYVTPTKVTRDAESLLFGHSRDYYSTIGPSPPHAVDFEASGNCAGHLSVGWIKGSQRLTCLRT